MSQPRERMSIAAALAILLVTGVLHVLMALLLEGVLLVDWSDRSLPTTDEVMEVALVPEDEAETEQAREERERNDRVVQNDALVEERPPEETDKASEFDNRVMRETAAPLAPRRPGQRPSSPGSSQSSQSTTSPSDNPSLGHSQGDAKRPEDEDSARAEDLRQSESGELSQQSSAAPPAGTPGLSGMRESLRETFGQRGSLDHFEEIDEGAETLLNTRRNRFASFFNRVREAIAQHWHPEVIHAARDPYGKVYGNKTRVTRLHIELAPDGSLRRIGIDTPAGISYLDEEAIRAVRAAQPFTNPPAQLVDPKTGKIEFSFSFILLLDGSKRLFRYKR